MPKKKDKEGSIELTLLLRVVYTPNGLDEQELTEHLEAMAETLVNRGGLTQDLPATVLSHEIQVRGGDVAEIEDKQLDAISETLNRLDDLANDADELNQNISKGVEEIRATFNKAGIDV